MSENYDKIIRLAWHDKTSFDELKRKFNVSEDEVIKIMRTNLKLNSFRLWRKRVNGRRSKHQKNRKFYLVLKIIKFRLMKLINIFILIFLISLPVKSDQYDSRLPSLFDQLYLSKGVEEINRITRQIWDIWHETNDIKIEADFYRGMESMRIHDLIMSIAFFTRVIEKKPDFAEGWNKRATAYFMLGEFDKSMLDINQTLNLEPRHFGALDGMGLIFIHLQQYSEAIKIYDQMLKFFPNNQSVIDKKNLMKEYLSKSA